ncbi:protein of unknown function [Streptomyces murinus]
MTGLVMSYGSARDGDRGLAGLHALVLHLLGQLHGLLDEGLHDLGLGDGLDDLALDEDLALAVAGGDAQVGLAGLAGAVDDAAHDGDAERDVHAGEARGDLFGELVDVDLGAAAGRAGDDLQAALAQVQGLQDLGADLDLLDRRGREGDADGVADALGEQRAEGDGRLDGALEGRARLGDAEVQGVVALRGELAVGLDHHDRVVVLDRDLDVAEVVLLEEGGFPQGALDERLRGGLAVLLEQAAVQGARVHTDADRGAVLLGDLGDLLDLVVELLDVARVHPDRGAAGLDGGEDVLGLEVDVRDHRELGLAGDGGERVGVVLSGAGHADDLAAGGGQLGDLLEGGADVGRTGRGHRLDRYGRVSADRHASDLDLPALAALGELGRYGRHAERNRSHLLCNPKSWIKIRPRATAGSGIRDYGTGACAGTSHPGNPLIGGRPDAAREAARNPQGPGPP